MLKLGAGQRIENKNKEVVGINVSAKTIKNKVAPPFRTVNFEIHFGKGIVEHEQVFDLLRKHCKENGPVEISNRAINIEGTGAWKTLSVANVKTGEEILLKKFYKADFGEVWSDPEYEQYVDALLENALVRKMSDDAEIDFDVESYSEVEALASDLNLQDDIGLV